MIVTCSTLSASTSTGVQRLAAREAPPVGTTVLGRCIDQRGMSGPLVPYSTRPYNASPAESPYVAARLPLTRPADRRHCVTVRRTDASAQALTVHELAITALAGPTTRVFTRVLAYDLTSCRHAPAFSCPQTTLSHSADCTVSHSFPVSEAQI